MEKTTLTLTLALIWLLIDHAVHTFIIIIIYFNFNFKKQKMTNLECPCIWNPCSECSVWVKMPFFFYLWFLGFLPHTCWGFHEFACPLIEFPQESVSIQRATKAAVAECRTDGWLQFDEGELQQRRNFMERNATWHMMQFTNCPPPPPTVSHLININNSNYTHASSTTTVTTRPMDPKLIKTHDLSLMFNISPHRENGTGTQDHDNCVESQTLQLFPTRNGEDGCSDDDNIHQQKQTDVSASAMNAPSQFFEFLPLKNWFEKTYCYVCTIDGAVFRYCILLENSTVFIVIDVMFQGIGAVIRHWIWMRYFP